MASKTAEGPKLSQDQIHILEENFNKVSKHPDSTTLMLIAAECGLTEEETQVRTQRHFPRSDSSHRLIDKALIEYKRRSGRRLVIIITHWITSELISLFGDFFLPTGNMKKC